MAAGQKGASAAVSRRQTSRLTEAPARPTSIDPNVKCQPPDFGTSNGMMRSDLAMAGRPAAP